MSWSDSAGDHETTTAQGDYRWERSSTTREVEWDDNWAWETAGANYRYADLRRVAVINESSDALTFHVEVASTETSNDDPYLFDRVNYNIYLDFEGQPYLVYLARSMWGDIEGSGILRASDDGWGLGIASGGGVNVQETDNGWNITVPKFAFTNPDGFRLWQGDSLQVTRIAVMDTYHNLYRPDFEETHTCDDGNGSPMWCYPTVRDVIPVSSDATIPITKQPIGYGPLVLPVESYGYSGTTVYERGYNATYLLEVPYYNLGREVQSFDVSADAPDGWRVIHPLHFDVQPRAAGTLPLLVERNHGDYGGWGRVGLTLTSQADPNTTFNQWFDWETFYGLLILTPAQDTLYVHANHAREGTWIDQKGTDPDANPSHAVPVMPYQKDNDTFLALHDFTATGPGYQLSGEGVRVSWNVTFPAAFEGTVAAWLENSQSEPGWNVLSRLEFGDVSVQAGENRRFQGIIPSPETDRFPPGMDLKVRFRAEGWFSPPPEGTRPIDYGMPPYAMSGGLIALAVQQQDTWVKIPLAHYNDTFDPGLFPDPLLELQSEGYRHYLDAHYVQINVNELETFTFNVTNKGLVSANTSWVLEGQGADWVRPVEKMVIIPPGGLASVDLRYVGPACFTSSNSTTARLIGHIDGLDRPLEADLHVEVRGRYDALPPQCIEQDESEFLATSGVVPALLITVAGMLVWRRQRRRA